ncbi:MAG: CDP-alcohol phosphatidyltransferase family protein [Synergistaceae bacterium]|nr:CDP-alcohol phosphatidyltransferase family protein [Synergistaceae bacterium]
MTGQQVHKLRILANWRRIVPTMVTLSALFFGFASILSTIEAMRLDVPALLGRSAQYIMLALILDGLDGNVARWLKGTTEFGAELDTFVDFLAFGVAPAALLYVMLIHGPSPFWRTILPAAIVFSGALRLSRFRLKDPLRGQGGFIGLPITVNSSWIALAAFAAQIMYPEGHILVTGPVSIVFQFLILVMISLQLSNLRYPKPSNKVRFFAPAVLAVLLLWALSETYAAWIATVLVFGCFVYVLTGPMIHKRSALRQQQQQHSEGK